MNQKQLLALPLVSLYAATALYAADTQSLGNIVVSGDADAPLVESALPAEQAASQSFNREGIEIFGGQTNISALKIIDMSPSVSFHSVDVFGSNESSFHDPMRIRGKNQSGPGGVLTVESLPLNSNPGGGKTIYDMENIAYIDLYKGYVPVDKSLGFSNLIGKVDLIVKRPTKKFGATVSQMVGSESTSRTFVRVDSGEIGDVKMFGSFSYMQGDKWKGEGDLERTNGMFGLTYAPNSSFKAELFAVASSDRHHNYYQMSYDEARNLDLYYSKDYGSSPALAAYAEYNKQEFDDLVLFSNISYRFGDGGVLSFKPYYLQDEGEYWFDASPADPTNTLVKQWMIDHRLYGGVLEYERSLLKSLRMKLGFWTHRQEPPGPPTDQRVYNVASGTPTFVKYGVLAEAEDHKFNSPFLEFSGEMGAFSYVAGIRYLDFELAGLKNHLGGTSLDYDTAIAQSTLDSWGSVESRTYTEWLPSLMLSYDVSPAVNLYADYTRSYGYDVNLFPTYVGKRSTFVAKNVTLQQLWNQQQPELSDNFDLGMHYRVGGLTVNPNLFYTDVTGKQISAYDAVYDVSYPTNQADAKSYGAELALTGKLTEELDFMLSGSYNRYYYTQNFKTSATATATVEGNQIPDAPKYTANAALTYRHGGWQVTPSMRYYSKRYGDADNTQKIPSCTLVDMDASYTWRDLSFAQEASFRLTMTNLMDEEYISSIVTPDNALAANTTKTSYQAGAPFGIYAGLSVRF